MKCTYFSLFDLLVFDWQRQEQIEKKSPSHVSPIASIQTLNVMSAESETCFNVSF